MIESVVLEGRAMAEARMMETCTVRYKTGGTTRDYEAGEEIPIRADRLVSRCRVKDARIIESDAGGTLTSIPRVELHLPVDSATLAIREDDQVVMADSCSPELAGRVYRIVATPVQSQATALRFPVEEV